MNFMKGAHKDSPALAWYIRVAWTNNAVKILVNSMEHGTSNNEFSAVCWLLFYWQF